jgi:hypothetical protein
MTAYLAKRIRERRDAARQQAASDEIMEQMLYKPRGFTGYRSHERIALAMVKHGETEKAIKASTDGVEVSGIRQWIPRVLINICHKASDDFFIGVMRAEHVVERDFAQASVPRLTDTRQWTDEQRAIWIEMRKQLTQVRHGLDRDRKTYRRQLGRRNDFA